MPMELSMTTEEQCRLSIAPTTPGGEPAEVDEAARWSVRGTCTVTPIDDLSAWLIAGEVGESIVTVACDANLGHGVIPLVDTCVVHVTMPMAAHVGLAAEPPMLQSDAP